MRPRRCAVSKGERQISDGSKAHLPAGLGWRASPSAMACRADFANVAASTDGEHDGKNRIL